MTRTYFIVGFLALVSLLSPSTCKAQQVVASPSSSLLQGIPEITQTSWEPGSYVDDRALQAYLHRKAIKVWSQEGGVSGTDIKASFEGLAETVSLPQFSKSQIREQKGNPGFAGAYKSTLVCSSLYNCGHCNQKHLSCAGGVVLSADGLVLTNHHVFDPNGDREIYSFVVMTSDGKVCPVVEVLAANEDDDLALVRVDAQGLTPVTLADKAPLPMDDLFIVGHPHRKFYGTSTGVVSRNVKHASQNGVEKKWMEITAPFGQGASGCGVFNDEGKLIGLVSRKQEMRGKSASGQVEKVMTLYKCVSFDAIQEMLEIAE